jgi:CRP-like cAMP-binding protein
MQSMCCSRQNCSHSVQVTLFRFHSNTNRLIALTFLIVRTYSPTEENLFATASHMSRVKYRRGECIILQGHPHSAMVIISSGSVERSRVDTQNQTHLMEVAVRGDTIGAHFCLRGDRAQATARCSTDVVAFILHADNLRQLFAVPGFAEQVNTYVLYLDRKHISDIYIALFLFG